MKKVLNLILLLIITPLFVFAEEKTKGEYGTHDDAINIIKETMKSYYIKGPKLQYNYAKATYGKISPEEATIQDNKYLVCAAYTYSVYVEAFGMKYEKNISEMPRYNYEITEAGASYYNDNVNNLDSLDDSFLIYYENTTNNNKYIYGDTDKTTNTGDFDIIVNAIKPGDLLAYTGHALIVYDVVTNPDTGKKDVLILNSTAKNYIRTRIDGTSRISYNIYKNSKGSNGFLDIDAEGTVQWLWLSESSAFVKNGELSCGYDECAVIRPFYKNSKGNAVFNYYIDKEQYNKSTLRTEYPGLEIEKTINIGDNNSVNIEDKLTYTIKITNKSNVDYNSTTYKSFYIEETISDYVDYISSTEDGSYKNKKVKWKIDSLKPKESIELTYTVVVKNNLSNISKKIESVGKFYSETDNSRVIATGTVENTIIPKSTDSSLNYKKCYEENKTKYNGLELIDKIYECAYDNEFKLNLKNNFKFENIFTKTTTDNPKVSSTIKIRTNLDSSSKDYYDMILNNYYSGLVTLNNLYYLPRFSNARAETINSNDFKNGDVLIYYIDNSKYTTESGIYAYIYIDDKFVGVNGTGSTRRNEFIYNYYETNKPVSEDVCQKYSLTASATCNYYYNLYAGYIKITDNKEEILEFVNYQTLYDKDYYVILRPEKLMLEINNESNSNDLNDSNVVDNETKVENPKTGLQNYTVVLVITLISYIVYKKIKKKNKFIKL